MPVKTETTTEKAPSKVFDVSKPGKSAANSTSRPILVTNRPMLQDPMVTPSDSTITSSKNEANPSSVKVTIKPLSDTDKSEPPKEETDQKNITIDDVPEIKLAGAADGEEASKPEQDVAVKQPSDDNSKIEEITKPPELEIRSEEPAAEVIPAVDESEDEVADEDIENESLPDTDTVKKGTKSAKDTAAIEAAAKQKEELEKLVESKEYYLPINSLERRRSLIVSIFGLFLIVTLGLLLVNMLLDIGYIRIEGVQPVTDFFSA